MRTISFSWHKQTGLRDMQVSMIDEAPLFTEFTGYNDCHDPMGSLLTIIVCISTRDHDRAFPRHSLHLLQQEKNQLVRFPGFTSGVCGGDYRSCSCFKILALSLLSKVCWDIIGKWKLHVFKMCRAEF